MQARGSHGRHRDRVMDGAVTLLILVVRSSPKVNEVGGNNVRSAGGVRVVYVCGLAAPQYGLSTNKRDTLATQRFAIALPELKHCVPPQVKCRITQDNTDIICPPREWWCIPAVWNMDSLPPTQFMPSSVC